MSPRLLLPTLGPAPGAVSPPTGHTGTTALSGSLDGQPHPSNSGKGVRVLLGSHSPGTCLGSGVSKLTGGSWFQSPVS